MGESSRGVKRAGALIGAAVGTVTLAGTAALTGAGVASADAAVSTGTSGAALPGGLVPIPGSAHEYAVHGIATPQDVLDTDKDLILGGGEVRATSLDGVTFHYFRLVDGVRIPMLRTQELCLPTIPCHAVILDDTTPVY